MHYILLLVLAYLAYGILEYRMHIRNLRSVPIRVHVNGTRGKSSVTRLIAAGLRAGGVRAAAKTTGSAARYIDPEGAEEPVIRPGPPNIREQLSIFARARRDGAQALVVECMALRPDLQRISEHQIVKSTVGVITNVRPDHLDVMGPTVDDVGVALAGTVPRGSALFTSERERAATLGAAARERGCDYHEVDSGGLDAGAVRGFKYVEHPDNVALALAVCDHLGVPREKALAGMRDAEPDPGALTVHRVVDGGKEIEFINAFAANDRESTRAVWDTIAPREGADRDVIVVASMRADRPDRAFQFGAILAEDLDADRYILTGGLTHPAIKGAVKLGLSRDRIDDMSGCGAQAIYDRVVELTGTRSIVVGVGNIGGTGAQVVRLFQSRSETT
ncbi:MAG: poly-gamma-glutamate synthase PgsB [Candidatus Eisenbacteria bacterium]|nr:poly-gamma-glutamate synthase PgsB [Candidatus Eisenbacteria bacterium]